MGDVRPALDRLAGSGSGGVHRGAALYVGGAGQCGEGIAIAGPASAQAPHGRRVSYAT